jgi:DNA-binding NarL/FixJ family response regulator
MENPVNPGEPIKVVIVEDQPPLLKNVVKLLSAFPEQVQVVGTALDGESGLKEVAALKPQVLLLDLELPGMNGIQVTQKLKQSHPEVEVLILTTFDDEQKVYEAMQAGASGYLVKLRASGDKIVRGIVDVWGGGTVLESQIARRFWNYFQSVQSQGAAKQNPWGLNELEMDLLRYVAKGLSNSEVGQVMSLERRTVRTHLGHIYKKMGVNTHVEAVVLALKSGLFQV